MIAKEDLKMIYHVNAISGCPNYSDRYILDVCCGSRMFWFDKTQKNTIYMDNRDTEETLCDGRILKIHPDLRADFTNIPFPDKSFKLVVFDPPHLIHVGASSWLGKKYGILDKDWPRIIQQGFKECFRVLDDYGILIFKWNEEQIKVKDILRTISYKPLFGHTTSSNGKTIWMCFLKQPIDETLNNLVKGLSTEE